MTAPAFEFDRLIDRRSLPSEKWGRYADRDVLPLWVADMDFAAPPAVLDALHGAASKAAGAVYFDLFTPDATYIGSDVTEFAAGDHVVGCLNVHCNQCAQCTAGRHFLCDNRKALQSRADGTSRVRQGDTEVYQMAGLGGFSEMMLTHRNALTKVPRELPLELGALLGRAPIPVVAQGQPRELFQVQ